MFSQVLLFGLFLAFFKKKQKMLVVGTPGFQDGVQIPVASLLNLCLQDSVLLSTLQLLVRLWSWGGKSLLNLSEV